MENNQIIKPKKIIADPIINLEIDEEELQSFAEANFGRELSDLELHRIKEYWYECEDAFFARLDFMGACIKDALNTKDTDWSGVDKDFNDDYKVRE